MSHRFSAAFLTTLLLVPACASVGGPPAGTGWGGPGAGGGQSTGGLAATGGGTGSGAAPGAGAAAPVGGAPNGGTTATGGGEATVSGGGGDGGVGVGGGGASGGAAAGVGGAGAAAPVSSYGHGVMPTTVTVSDARAAYDVWKTQHLEDCGGGVSRVRWENAKLDATVSEGIGYGMLLAVAWNEQSVFDGLLAYAKLMQQPLAGGGFGPPPTNTGLMHWLRYGCDAHRATTYSDYPDNAAADADIDMAMALLMADCRWGGSNYAATATTLIAAIKQHMFIQDSGLNVLQPGDSTWFDDLGAGCVNYSYFAPAYYRAFAAHVPADAAFWNQAADDSYTLLAKASSNVTGLVRNWGSADGGEATQECFDAYNHASSYGDDAARTPWRIATDYLWYGTEAAKTWTDRVTTWVKLDGIASTVQWYNLDGSPDTQAGGYADHTVINVGPFAVGAMTSDQATVDQFAAEVLAIPSGDGTHDGEYFQRMLKALSLSALVGGFTQCGGN